MDDHSGNTAKRAPQWQLNMDIERPNGKFKNN